MSAVESSEVQVHVTGQPFTPRQEKLLADLEALILAEGFADLTVAGLAGRLHCSRRTLYEVADSKEDLVLLVLDRILHRVGAAAHEASTAATLRLDRIQAYLLASLPELRRISMQFATDIEQLPSAHSLIRRHYSYAARSIEAIIVEGQQAGEFVGANPAVVVETIRAGAESLLNPDVLRRTKLSYAQALEELTMLLARGLRAG